MSEQRKEKVQKAVEKALEVIKKMQESDDIEYVLEKVAVSKNMTLEINCIRLDQEDSSAFGEALYFEVYALDKNERAIDCMTLTMYRNFEEDITYLINCYL